MPDCTLILLIFIHYWRPSVHLSALCLSANFYHHFSICLPIKKTVNGSVIVLNFKYMYTLIRSIKWGFVWLPFPLKTIPSLTDYCFMSYSPDALTFTSDSGSGIDGNLQCTGNEVDIAQCPGFQQQEITCNEHIEINCSTWFYLCKVSIVFMYRIGQF